MSRPTNPMRDAYLMFYGQFTIKPTREFSDEMMCQLSCCKSDAARRLILGRTEQYEEGEVEPQITLRCTNGVLDWRL
jgi:hypothetical protein